MTGSCQPETEIMGSVRGFLLAVLCFSCWSVNKANAELIDGLYVSNGTDILRIVNPDSTSSELKSVYKQTGTIVGLAYEKSSGMVFWSTVDVLTRGIYSGNTDSSGEIQNVSKIVEHEVLEVNGLTFDWVSRHIYWTDSRKKTVEVSEANGTNRRILLMTGLACPRGIYADPVSGFLFWTDQGHKRIERSKLDGSDRKVIVDQNDGNVGLPNQIIVDDRKIYWVDSQTKTLQFSNVDGLKTTRGSNRLTAADGKPLEDNEHVFGLAIDGQKAYVTKWNTGRLIRTSTNTGGSSSVLAGNLGDDKIFSAIFVRQIHQQSATITNPCQSKGCGSLCLPISKTEARCTCPSYEGKTLGADKKSCGSPSSIVLFAVASSGFVCFRDAKVEGSNELETYVVGRSLRPVAVAYDSSTQVVYWSDVRERTIHSARIDGESHKILLGSQDGIGLVEGMVVDVTRRQLFYTNIGSVLIEDTPYSWHRVETIRLPLDNTQVKVKTLVTTADKPRGLALDSKNGHLYYTDWGSRASIVRIDLDGSDATLVRTGLDNPNGIAIANGKLYFVDSHFKTRQKGYPSYPSSNNPKNGSLYAMNLDGSGLTDVLVSSAIKFQTPFGLAAGENGDLYVSDWDTKSLSVLKNSQAPATDFLAGIDEIMAVYFSPYSTRQSGSNGCSGKSCSDLCLASNASDVHCTCNSYGGKSFNGSSCVVPKNFLLVADMNSIKIVSLDERESNPYIAYQGNPYLANYAALTYNQNTETVYYSDVNRRAIRALYLKNSTTEIIYRINDVIDGLVFHENELYWTDYVNGKISKLRIGDSRHTVVISGLSRPRGIRIHDDIIYWTEWGDKPRVARRMLSANVEPEVLYDNTNEPKIVWPNGLFIDEAKTRLYFVDGNKKSIFNCSLTGGCQSIPGTESVLKHAYDVWFIDGAFYYSDWKSGAINAFRPNKPEAAWQVVGGLMRPTQMYIPSTPNVTPKGCDPTNACSSGECVSLIVNPVCDCKDKVPGKDRKSCTASSATCPGGSKNYKYGQEFAPKQCVNCQCLVGTSAASNESLDREFSNSVCRRTECPPLDCPTENIKAPDSNECCPTCTRCGIKITNCPKGTLSLTLPADLGFVVNDYLPSVRDCKGLSREISFERNPASTVFEKGSTTVSVTARTKIHPQDTDTCSYTVTVSDKTPPTIKCPADLTRYTTDGSPVDVQWDSAVAFDNVGLSGSPVSSIPWGSSFKPGSKPVTYTATDTSGQSSSCTFTVNVSFLSSTYGACKVPAFANAQVNCGDTDNNGLTCTFTGCNLGYRPKEKNYRGSFSCKTGNWTPNINDDLLRGTCIKEKQQSVVGSLDVTVSGVCSSDIDLRYVEKFLQFSVKKDFVRGTDFQETVTASCEPSTNNLIVKVKLTGDAEYEQEINDKLNEIGKELSSGFLKVNYRNSKGVQSAQITTTPVVNPARKDCLPGEAKTAENKCEVCAAGKYRHANDICENCEENEYNDMEGQTKCKPCPGGKKSATGAFIVDQCKTPEVTFPILPVAILIAILLLIVVVIIVVVICKRRRASYPKRHSTVHGNTAYGCYLDDETYDKIDEPKMDFTPLAPPPSNQNHYEGLQGNGNAADSYDVIGGGAGDLCEGGGGSIGGSSTRSTPSYLAPKGTPPYLTPVI